MQEAAAPQNLLIAGTCTELGLVTCHHCEIHVGYRGARFYFVFEAALVLVIFKRQHLVAVERDTTVLLTREDCFVTLSGDDMPG